MGSNEKVIEIKNIYYSINENKILKGIDLNIIKGEFVGLIGPNGAGKTTLLKSLNGINEIESGEITILSKKIREMKGKEIAKNIALMNQNTTIGFAFPCIDVVMMGRYPYLKGMQSFSKADRDISKKYMEFTDTMKFKERMITELSGGERQRVLFAKVLAQETDIILLDEPTASLDITHEEQIFKYSKSLAQNGRTVIAAVHDLRIAAKYCSRLILMNQGEVVADGKPDDVLTSSNLSRAYGVEAYVYKNPFSNMIDFHTFEKDDNNRKKSAHVICGGGSGIRIIHRLFKEGIKFTTGIFKAGDIDESLCDVMKITQVEEEENQDIIKECDFVILCNINITDGNIKKLKILKQAKHLIIIEDTPIEERDMTGGIGKLVYEELKNTHGDVKIYRSEEFEMENNV